MSEQKIAKAITRSFGLYTTLNILVEGLSDDFCDSLDFQEAREARSWAKECKRIELEKQFHQRMVHTANGLHELIVVYIDQMTNKSQRIMIWEKLFNYKITFEESHREWIYRYDQNSEPLSPDEIKVNQFLATKMEALTSNSVTALVYVYHRYLIVNDMSSAERLWDRMWNIEDKTLMDYLCLCGQAMDNNHSYQEKAWELLKNHCSGLNDWLKVAHEIDEAINANDQRKWIFELMDKATSEIEKYLFEANFDLLIVQLNDPRHHIRYDKDPNSEPGKIASYIEVKLPRPEPIGFKSSRIVNIVVKQIQKIANLEQLIKLKEVMEKRDEHEESRKIDEQIHRMENRQKREQTKRKDKENSLIVANTIQEMLKLPTSELKKPIRMEKLDGIEVTRDDFEIMKTFIHNHSESPIFNILLGKMFNLIETYDDCLPIIGWDNYAEKILCVIKTLTPTYNQLIKLIEKIDYLMEIYGASKKDWLIWRDIGFYAASVLEESFDIDLSELLSLRKQYYNRYDFRENSQKPIMLEFVDRQLLKMFQNEIKSKQVV